jgi:hypothetical protein
MSSYGMRKILVAILIFSSVVACNVDKYKEIDRSKLGSRMTQDAYLYFRNMRQTYYDRENMEKAGLHLYRHEDRNRDTTGFYMHPVIVVNWKLDQAYAIMENSTSLDADTVLVRWSDPESDRQGEILLTDKFKSAQLDFFTSLYGHVQKEHTLSFKTKNGKLQPLWDTPAAQEAFRITMLDYYNLTGVL